MQVSVDFEFGCGAFSAWQLETGNFIGDFLDTTGMAHVTLVAIPAAGGAIAARSFGDFAAAVKWVEGQQKQGCNVYFEPNETQPGCAKKPTKGEIVAAVVRHADVDPRDDGEFPFVEERRRLLKLAAALAAAPDVAPTFIIDSGNGMQCIWVTHREPNSAAVTERVESENAAIAAALGGDAVHNVDRLLRLPGTLNFPNATKLAKGRQVARAHVLSYGGRFYSDDEAAALSARLERLVAGTGLVRPSRGTKRPSAGAGGTEGAAGAAEGDGAEGAAGGDAEALIEELRAAGAETITDIEGLPSVLKMKLAAALTANRALAERWAGSMDGLTKAEDHSAFDFSLAALAKIAGFTHVEAGLVLCGCPHGKTNADTWPRPVDRLRHVARCVARSGGMEQEGWLPPGYFSNETGIWFAAQTPGAGPVFVCGPFTPVAGTSDESGKSHGTLLQWALPSGRVQRWPVPHRLLHDSGNAIAAELADAGLRCAPGTKAHERLKNLIFRVGENPPKYIRSVARSGWHRIDDNDVYVLPSGEVFGHAGVEVIVRTASVKTGESTQARGTLAAWQDNVARLAVGNSRTAFGIATAFAAPLLNVVGEASGGFNAVGASQIGKTYGIAQTAASVCGKARSYIRSWNATQNGLEIICAETCDMALILDELGQADARNLQSTVYQIFNESGKSRMTKTADAARPTHNWRLFVLSTGERTVEQRLAELHIKPPAGVNVRLASFPADAGRGHGIYETLHGFTDGAALSRHFNDASQRYYGTASRAFLERLGQTAADEIKAQQAAFRNEVLPKGGDGQVISVAMRFGLVAAAGELATTYGVTGWPEGEATRAAKTCFEAWLGKRGGVGPDEERAMLDQVRSVLERHGESRFIKFGPLIPMKGQTEDPSEIRDQDHRVYERYGYARHVDGTVKEYLVFRQQWADVFCRGFDPEAVAKVLADQSFLARDGKNFTRQHRVPGVAKRTRYYTIDASII